jgi:glyoxylase-like metal-dependent hydrolase (beta-lactamase superfamily II)
MRRIKGFLIFVFVIALLAGGGVAFLRVGRSRVSDPIAVKPDIVAVTNAGGVYVFASKVGGGAILFDTGLDPEGRPLDAALGALGSSRSAVTDVFLTHGHMDHMAGAALLPKAKLHLGAGDVPLAEGKAAPDRLVGKIFAAIVPAPPVSINQPLTGPASFDVGDGKTVKAYPVPGHTAGSYAFLFDGVLFVGDIMVFKQGQLELPPAMFSAEPEQNKAAIRSLKLQLASDTVDTICTAHGGCTPKGLGKSLLDDLISRV